MYPEKIESNSILTFMKPKVSDIRKPFFHMFVQSNVGININYLFGERDNLHNYVPTKYLAIIKTIR